MDEYLIYFVPYIAVGCGIMLVPFVSYGWPNWLTAFVEWCAEMVNGVWVAALAMVLLMSISVPTPLAIMLSWPVMYFSGRYFVRLSDRMDERSREIKRQGWEAHMSNEDNARKASKQNERP